MRTIATLTLNPTIDVAYEVSRVFPMHKMRASHEYHNPGGGGINVARVFVRLGLVSEADVVRSLSEQLGIPLVAAEDFPESTPEVEGLLPEFLHANAVCPLRLEGQELHVAMAVPQMEALLLVPSRVAGGALVKVANSAGTRISPPPPTIASTKPASSEASETMIHSMRGIVAPPSPRHRPPRAAGRAADGNKKGTWVAGAL